MLLSPRPQPPSYLRWLLAQARAPCLGMAMPWPDMGFWLKPQAHVWPLPYVPLWLKPQARVWPKPYTCFWPKAQRHVYLWPQASVWLRPYACFWPQSYWPLSLWQEASRKKCLNYDKCRYLGVMRLWPRPQPHDPQFLAN